MEKIIIKLGNSNNTRSIKEAILNKIASFPFLKWHGVDTEEDPAYSVAYAGKGDYLTLGTSPFAHFAAINKKYIPNFKEVDLDTLLYPRVKRYNATRDLYLAMREIDNYAKFVKDYNEDPGYDFVLDGKPVRIYQKFIQIGTEL